MSVTLVRDETVVLMPSLRRHLRLAGPDDTPPTLDELIERVAGGDNPAFELLFDRVANSVFGVVRRVLRDPAQSEEVTQEVLLEVWRTAARFEPDRGSASTWIHTMAHRRAIDRVRSAQAAHDRDDRVAVRNHMPAFDEVADEVETTSSVNRYADACTDSPTCSASRSRWPTTAATPIARSPNCSGCRWAPSRPGCATA